MPVLLPLLLLALLLLVAYSQPATLYSGGLEYNPDDFVLAQPTCVHRLPLVTTSRRWRGAGGIRAYVVVNDTGLAARQNADPEAQRHREAYGYYEDDSLDRGTWRGGGPGEQWGVGSVGPTRGGLWPSASPPAVPHATVPIQATHAHHQSTRQPCLLSCAFFI